MSDMDSYWSNLSTPSLRRNLMYSYDEIQRKSIVSTRSTIDPKTSLFNFDFKKKRSNSNKQEAKRETAEKPKTRSLKRKLSQSGERNEGSTVSDWNSDDSSAVSEKKSKAKRSNKQEAKRERAEKPKPSSSKRNLSIVDSQSTERISVTDEDSNVNDVSSVLTETKSKEKRSNKEQTKRETCERPMPRSLKRKLPKEIDEKKVDVGSLQINPARIILTRLRTAKLIKSEPLIPLDEIKIEAVAESCESLSAYPSNDVQSQEIEAETQPIEEEEVDDPLMDFYVDTDEADFSTLENSQITGNKVSLPTSATDNCVGYMEPTGLRYKQAYPGVEGATFDNSDNTLTGFLKIAPRTVKPLKMTLKAKIAYWILKGEITVRSTAFLTHDDSRYLYGKQLSANSCLLVPPFTAYTIENRSSSEVLLGYVQVEPKE